MMRASTRVRQRAGARGPSGLRPSRCRRPPGSGAAAPGSDSRTGRPGPDVGGRPTRVAEIVIRLSLPPSPIAGRAAAEAFRLAVEYDPRPPSDSGSVAEASQGAKDYLAAR